MFIILPTYQLVEVNLKLLDLQFPQETSVELSKNRVALGSDVYSVLPKAPNAIGGQGIASTL